MNLAYQNSLVKDRVLNLGLLASLFLIYLFFLLVNNGIFLFICFSSITIVLSVLWRYGKPGILPFAFLTQWSQVVAYVVWMNVMGKDIEFLSKNAPYAIMSACGGLIIMALVFRWLTKKLPIVSFNDLVAVSSLWDTKKVLILYFASSLFLGSIGFILGNTSGLAQIFMAISSIKWVFFIVYGFMVFTGKGSKIIFLFIILFEFVSGLYSYFSSFKEVIFFGIILFFSVVRTISLKQIITGFVSATGLLALLLTWTIIKGNYRQYLNEGKGKQVVTVSKTEAFSKIREEVQSLSVAKYEMAIEAFLYRAQYIYHLARTMDRVPAVLPHEGGKMWLSNLNYILVPRLLNPDKPIFEATVKTIKYTGIQYWGAKQGASFSLGYFADSYIDFGYFFMVIPLMLIASFVALIYMLFYKLTAINLLARIAFINVSLYNFTAFESDGVILVGRLYTTFIILYVIARFVFPRIQKWAYKSV